MKKPVVWIINQFAGTPTSGWGERHFYFSKHWVERGYDVKILSGAFNHVFSNFPETNGRYTIEDVEGITFCWVEVPKYKPTSLKRFWSMIMFAWRCLKAPVAELGKPDIILVSSMPLFPVVTGYKLKRKYNVKRFIFEVRDLWPLTPIQIGGYSKWHPFIIFLKWVERFGFRKADDIVALMAGAGSYINPISKEPSKLHHVPNGINVELLETHPLEDDIVAAIPTDKFIVGYTGSLGLANAMEYFFDAVEMLKDNTRIHFVVVGDGYLKDEYAAKYGSLPNLTFIRKIRKDQVQSMIGHFDVCFLSWYNKMLYHYGVSANKYFDYMLAGKPVLAAIDDNIPDPIISCGCGIRVVPENPVAIKIGIEYLASLSKNTLDMLGKKGYHYVRRLHDTKYLAEKYIGIFEGTPVPEPVEEPVHV